MVDIAKIGFAADTSGLDKASDALQVLIPATAAAEAGAEAVGAALTAAGSAGKDAAQGATTAGKGFTSADSSARKYVKTLNELSDVQKRINGVTGAGKDQFSNIGRASDIEAYGKAMDDLRGKYDPLFAAGRAYKATLADINNAYKVGALNQNQYTNAIANTKAAFTQQVGAINKTTKATEGLSWQAKNLSYQLVDITQGVASGVPLFQIFAQQAGQVGQALASVAPGQNLFKEIAKSVLGLFTPMRVLLITIVAVIGAVTALTLGAISNAKAMDDLSKSTDIAVGRLRSLQQATSYKGIGIDEFAQGMQNFSKSVFDAKNNAGELKGLMIANGEAARTEAEYFAKVADMVARTSSGIQKRNILEAAGLPTTQKWVDFMSQGARGIEAVQAATVTFSAAAEKNLVEKAKQFDEAWNKGWTNFTNYLKSATIETLGFFGKIAPWLDRLEKLRSANVTRYDPPVGSATRAAMDQQKAQGNTFADRFSGDAANNAASNSALAKALNDRATALANAGKEEVKTREQLMLSNSQQQQRLSILGDMATVEDRVKQKQLELNAAGLMGVGVSDTMATKILNATRAQEQMNRVQAQAQIGIFNMNAAQTAANNTLQMWIDKGLVDKNNSEQMATARQVLNRSIEQTGEAAQVAASKFPQFTQAMLDAGNTSKQIDNALTSSFNNLVSPIQDVINGTTSMKDGFRSMGQIVVKAIQEIIIKMLILKPLMSMFGGASGIGGGLLSLFGLGTKSAKGNVFANDNHITAYAKGGAFSNSVVSKPTMFANGGKLNVMGEAGPEAVMPLRRGPNGSLGVQMYGSRGGSGGAYAFNDNSQYHIGGNVSQSDLDNLRAENDRKLAKQKQELPNYLQDLRRRGIRA